MKIGQKVSLNKKGFDEEVAVGTAVHNFLGLTVFVPTILEGAVGHVVLWEDFDEELFEVRFATGSMICSPEMVDIC